MATGTRRVRRSVLTAVMGAAIMMSASGTLAQEINLEPISIFATASGGISSFAYPGQVTVVTREEVEDLGASRAADVFKGVPGVSFEGGPRRTGQVPTIRGFEGEGVVILFDDARQNFISGHVGRFFLEADLLKSVEVVRGPTSSVFGSGAVGGVLAFRTIDASDLLEPGQLGAIRVKSGFQSVDEEQSYSVTGVQRNESGSLDVVAHLGMRNSSDIKLGSGAVLPADDDIKNVLVKGTFVLGSGLKWANSFTFFDKEGVEPSNPQGGNVASADNPNVDRDVLSRTFQSKLEYNPSSNNLVDARSVVYQAFNRVEEGEKSADRTTLRDVTTWGFKADNRSRFRFGPDVNMKLTYGTDIYRDTQKGRDTTSTAAIRGGVPNARSDFLGVFAEAEIDIGRPGKGLGQLSFIPGLRFDRYSSQSDLDSDIEETAVSPKIAAAYRPFEWLSVFGNYGSAFRAPSYNESYSIGTHFRIPLQGGIVANEFITNPGLQPEEALGWEAGASLKFDDVLASGDKLRVKGSYWHNDVENLISIQVAMPFGNLSAACFGAPSPPFPLCVGGAAAGWTSQYVNTSNAELDGVELDASYDSQWVFLRTTYSQIDGRDVDTGLHTGNLYPNKFFVNAAFKLPPLQARIGARATIAAEFDKVNSASEKRDSYKVFDLYAVWEPTIGGLKGLRVDLGVDNVTDEDYETVFANVSEEGRNYKAGISYTLPLCGTTVCN